MRFGFVVSAAIFTAAFLCANYTDLGIAIRHNFQIAPAAAPDLVGRIPTGDWVIKQPSGEHAVMSTAAYNAAVARATAARAAWESRPDVPAWAYALGLLWLYAVCGLHVVNEWERLPVLRFGKYARTAGPGLVWIDPLLHRVMPAESIKNKASFLWEKARPVKEHVEQPVEAAPDDATPALRSTTTFQCGECDKCFLWQSTNSAPWAPVGCFYCGSPDVRVVGASSAAGHAALCDDPTARAAVTYQPGDVALSRLCADCGLLRFGSRECPVCGSPFVRDAETAPAAPAAAD